MSGPFDRWPTRSGFDKFYGFIGGETNQWAPAIYDGTIRIEPPHRPGYHFTTDMTDQAIKWVSAQHTLTPEKPFFMYFATGATHAPHQVPKEWIAKYKGQFADGWDKLRERTFARQKQMGVIPADAKLTPRPKEIPAWDGMSAAQKRLFERQMETFAGFAEQTDYEIGRLVDGPEPRQPTRAAEVQGAEAQAPDGCGGRRAARPGRARPRVATALRDRILSWPPPR